jgi:tol-pal system protein YbgF
MLIWLQKKSNSRKLAYLVILCCASACALNTNSDQSDLLRCERDRAQLEAMKKQVIAAQTQTSQVEQELASVRRETAILTRTLTSCRQENKRLEDQITELESRLSGEKPRSLEVEKTPSPPPAGPTAAMMPAELYNQALQDYRAQAYKKALEAFRDFLERFPSHSLSDNAQFWMGNCYLKLNRRDEALETLSGVLRKYPKGNKVPDTMLQIAIIRKSQGEQEEYRDLLAEIIGRYPQTEAAKIAKRKLALTKSEDE